jgi:hypothetical protein
LTDTAVSTGTGGSARRWIPRISILLAALVGLLVAALVTFHLHERRRVRLALEAIRTRGEPVMAEEILAQIPEHPSRFVENAARFRDIHNLAFGDSFTASEIDD